MKILSNIATKKTDLLVLAVLGILAYCYCRLTLDMYIGRGLFGGAVFTLPAVIYLGLRSSKPWRKIFVSTLLFGGLLGFFFEFVQEFNQSYAVVNTVFPKLLGVVPLDNVLGHMMMALLAFTFYEHFISKNKDDLPSSRVKYAVALAVFMPAAVVALYYIDPSMLSFNYSYAYLGAVAILPPMIYAYRHPKLASELTLMIPYFFILYLVVEQVAVKHGWWVYPGQYYIGQVTLFEAVYPIEELLFWMLCYAAALISYYKIFIDRPDKTKSLD